MFYAVLCSENECIILHLRCLSIYKLSQIAKMIWPRSGTNHPKAPALRPFAQWANTGTDPVCGFGPTLAQHWFSVISLLTQIHILILRLDQFRTGGVHHWLRSAPPPACICTPAGVDPHFLWQFLFFLT